MKKLPYVTITMIAWAAASSSALAQSGPFVPRARLAEVNPNPQQTHFAIFGDTQNALGGNLFMQRFGQVAQGVAQTNPNFVQTVGDNIYLGWPVIQRPQWRQWQRNAEPLLEVAPVLPGWGNHDANTNAIYRRFSLPGELFARLNQGAYSYDAGPVHVSVLNDSYRNSFLLSLAEPALYSILPSFEMRQGSRQYRWLERDLASVPNDQWKIVITHKPPYSIGGGYRDVQNLTQLADQYGVNLFVSGHTHTYETSVPIYASEPVNAGSQGTIYLVAGTSGARPSSPSARRAQQTPWARTAQTGETGYVTIDATPQAMNVQSYTVDGQPFDSISLSRPWVQ